MIEKGLRPQTETLAHIELLSFPENVKFRRLTKNISLSPFFPVNYSLQLLKLLSQWASKNYLRTVLTLHPREYIWNNALLIMLAVSIL